MQLISQESSQRHLNSTVQHALKHELDRRYASSELQRYTITVAHNRFRYQGIPPFGRGGIQKITSNRSELKKMTTHDYEDLLQVGIKQVFDLPLINLWCSVQYLSLMACPNHIIRASWNSFLIWCIGMALPNCACTRNLLWICCLKPLHHSAAVFGTSRRRHALCYGIYTPHWNL